MATLLLNEAKYLMDIPSLGEEIHVRDFDGEEEVSRLYKFDLNLMSENPDISFDSVINKRATFTLLDADDTPHAMGGIIKRFRQTAQLGDWYVYRAEFVPSMYRLTLNYQTRVYQEMTVKDIVSSVLEDAGFASGSDFSFRLNREGPVREYTTQYKETDFDFVSRLLEFEGIHFYFEQSGGVEKMVMTDDSSGNPSINGAPDLTFRQSIGMVPAEGKDEHVMGMTYEEQVVTGLVMLKDYNYREPNSNMLVDSQINGDMPGVYYDYADHYKNEGEGKELAQIRNQEIESQRVIVTGDSNCTRLRGGHKWSLEDHFRGSLNREYMITKVRHQGSQIGGFTDVAYDFETVTGREPVGGDGAGRPLQLEYSNEFTCVPASVVYRPARVTEKPQLPGIMTAAIETAGGEYAFIDDQGRYHVKMPFDLESTPAGASSKPIRMAQPYSGPDYGIHFPNHADTEMIWACVDGNVDRPLGLGTAPNPNNTSPSTAANKPQNVIRTWGKNELTFDDTQGEENILMIATKDHTVQVANDESFTVDNDQTMTVKNDQTISVNNNQTMTVDVDQTITVKNDQTMSVNNDRTLTVDNNETVTVKNDQTISVNNNQTLTVDVDRTKTVHGQETNTIDGTRTTTVKSGESLTVQSGGRSVTVASGDDTHTISGGSQTVTVSADRSVTVSGSDTHTVSGARTATVTGAETLTVNGGRTETITGADGNTVNGSKTITVNGPSCIITCGASSLELHSDGTINLVGNMVNVTGNAGLALEGGPQVDIHAGVVISSADSSNTVTGGICMIEGGATATVKAGAVLLNP